MLLRVRSQLQATTGCRADAVLLLQTANARLRCGDVGFVCVMQQMAWGVGSVSSLEHNTSGAMQKIWRRAARLIGVWET